MTMSGSRFGSRRRFLEDGGLERYYFPIVPTLIATLVAANVASAVLMMLE